MYWDKKKERRQKYNKRNKSKDKNKLKDKLKTKEDKDDLLENRNPRLPGNKDSL